MKTYDFNFNEESNNHNIKVNINKQEDDYDFDNIGVEINSLVKFYAINKYFNMKELMLNAGIDVLKTTMYCPFHDDEDGGKPSAKYHPDTDLLYCFSESKIYSAYHVLKLIYKADMEQKFYEAWTNLSDKEKEELILKYNKEDNVDIKGTKFINPIWKKYKAVHSKFRENEVSFKQHKNALYKLFTMIYKDEVKKNEIIMNKLREGSV